MVNSSAVRPKTRVRRTVDEACRLILEAAEGRPAAGGPEAARVRAVAADVDVTDAAVWTYGRRHLDESEFDRLRREFAQLDRHVGAVACPVLVVHGAESEAMWAATAARLASRFRHGCWATAEHAGHTVHGDHPAGLSRELCTFVGNLEPSPPG